MRIAVVCTDLGVRVPGDKGASIHLQAITRAFASTGHEVLLVGVAGHGDPGVPVPTVLLPHPGRSTGLERERRKLAFVETTVRATSDAVRRFAPDMIYERLSLFGTAGTRLAAATEAIHVVEVNALLAAEEATWRQLHLDGEATRRERAVLSSCDLRVCVSAEVARGVERVAPGRPTLVVPNGVDTTAFRSRPSREAARRQFGVDSDRPVVGFVGALRPWHGLDVAIDVLSLLPEVVLAVAGDGPVRADLEQRARQAGVDGRVRWYGRLPHGSVPAFLRALDVAIAPYPALPDFTFSPLKLYEYVAAGVPIVASEAGQVRDVLRHAGSGLLVEPGNVDALATGIRAVLHDLAVWQGRADRARTRALRADGWDERARAIVDALPVAAAEAG